MQATTQFEKRNPLQSLEAMAQAIALPHDYRPRRYPSFPAIERTAVAGFNIPRQVAFPTDKTELKVGLFRDAAWPCFISQDIESWLQIVSYGAWDAEGASQIVSTNDVSFQVAPTPTYATVVNNPNATTTKVKITGAVEPPWKYPIIGGHQDKTYTYWPASTKLYAVLRTTSHATSGSMNVHLDVEVWREANRVTGVEFSGVQLLTTNLGTLFGPLTATKNSWVRPAAIQVRNFAGAITIGEFDVDLIVTSGIVTYTPSATDAGTVAVSNVLTYGFLPLAPVPEFDVTERPWASTRTTAASVLITNVTKVMDKEGTALAGRLQNTYESAWNFDASSLAVLHPAEKAMLALETGFYTYSPPSADMAQYYDHTCTLEDGSILPRFRLDNPALVNCVILTDSDPTTHSSFAINVDWHIEFRNNSTLFQIGMSGMTLEAYHQALLVLAQYGYFFANETHRSILGKIIHTVRKMGMPIVKAIAPRPWARAIGYGARTLDRYVNAKPNTTPKTTSALTNGMIPRKQRAPRKPKRQRVKVQRRRRGNQ